MKYVFHGARAIQASDKALRIVFGEQKEPRWVPQSQIDDDSDVYDAKENSTGDLVLKGWLAEKEGWDKEADEEVEEG